jgi:hypothetical protein
MIFIHVLHIFKLFFFDADSSQGIFNECTQSYDDRSNADADQYFQKDFHIEHEIEIQPS